MGRRIGTIDPEKEKYWREIFKRFQKSGEPFKKFCAKENISPNTFQFWRKELRRRDEEHGIVSAVSKGDNRPSQLAEKTAFWKQIIEDIKVHPGSENSFCRQRGISSGSLHAWRKRLGELNSPAKASPEPHENRPDFVPLHVVERGKRESKPKPKHALPEPESHQIDITLNDGTKIAAPANVSVDMLLKLVNGLRH